MLLFAALYWTFDLALLRAGVPDPLDDTWEYGVVARHLLAGDGFRTGVIHPPLWSLRDSALTVPVLIHGPLLPAVAAPALKLVGPGAIDRAAWLSAAFALLAALAIVRLGARRLDAPVGAAAAALFTVSPLTLRAVHHDPSLVLGAWLLTLALDLLARPRPRAHAAGVVLGLAALARPEMIVAPIMLVPLAGRAAWRTALVFGACALPWWVHTLRASGSPWFNLSSYLLVGYWDGRPGLSVLRDFDLPPAHWPTVLRAALPTLVAKWVGFFPHALKRALLAPTGATGWLAIAGAVSVVRAPRTRAGGVAALALAAIPLAIMTLTVYDARYLTPFLPLWALAAAAGAQAAAGWLPPWARRPRAWVGLLGLLALPSFAPALREERREARRLERRLVIERRALAALTARAQGDRGAARPMFSDTPDFVAFVTGRPVIWVTRTEFDRLPLEAAHDRPARGGEADVWFHDRDGGDGITEVR